jgi:acetyl esterase/lipase
MILLALALALLFLASWIVVPAPTMTLLNLAVAVPEISPLLLPLSLAFALLALAGGATTLHRVAAASALLAAALCAIPIAQAVTSARGFSDSFNAAGITADASGGATVGQRLLAVRRFLPLAAGDDVIVTRGVSFAAPGGPALTLDVYRTHAPRRGLRPILVQIYGGAWQRGAPGDDALFARYFAARGYVVVAIDYRHAPRWIWPAQLADVQAALAWIGAHAGEYKADPARTALIGRSSGGQLALMAAYKGGPLPVRAVVSYYGPTNLLEGWRQPPRPDPLPVRPTLEAYLGGTPDAVPGRYQDASPVNHVSAAAPPTLLIYGRRDHIVEARFGRELAERLRRAGGRPVLLELPWAEHAFDAIPFGLGAQVSLYYTERFLASALR